MISIDLGMYERLEPLSKEVEKTKKKLDIAFKALGDIIRAGKGKDDQAQGIIALDALVDIKRVDLP